MPVQILVGSDDQVSTPDTIRGALTRTGRDDIDLRVATAVAEQPA